MFSPWITAYKHEAFHLQLSVDDGIACIHCKVFKRINKSRLELLREAFKEVCFQLEDKGFDRIYAHTPNLKFAKLVTGDTFHHICDIMDEPFIVWEFEEFLYG